DLELHGGHQRRPGSFEADAAAEAAATQVDEGLLAADDEAKEVDVAAQVLEPGEIGSQPRLLARLEPLAPVIAELLRPLQALPRGPASFRSSTSRPLTSAIRIASWL